jgi:hypothetical protein
MAQAKQYLEQGLVMSLVKIDKEKFLLIKYSQESFPEVNNLKEMLLAESKSGKERDTIIEFINTSAIYSTEIGVIVQFLKTLHGTSRTLRIVASNYICEMMITMNIHKIPNLTFYSNIDTLQEIYPDVDFNAL